MRPLTILPILASLCAMLALQQTALAEDVPATGLKLWLKADTVSGIPNGSPVGTWVDQSGNGLDVSQTNASLRPTYVSNAVGGRPAIRFDGSDYYAHDNVLGSSLTGLDQATIFIVLKQAGSDPHNTSLAWGTDTNRLLLHTTYDDGLHFQHGNTSGTIPPASRSAIVTSQPPAWDDTFHVATFLRSGLDGGIWVDGATMPLATVNFCDTPEVDESHPLYVGSDMWGNTFTGDIAEILVYSRALSASELNSVTGYLSTKYDVVPEPASLSLLILGGFAAMRRRTAT